MVKIGYFIKLLDPTMYSMVSILKYIISRISALHSGKEVFLGGGGVEKSVAVATYFIYYFVVLVPYELNQTWSKLYI